MLTYLYESAEDPPAPYVDLQISPPRREHLRVLVTVSRRTNVLIGRDLLNQMTITLDGPHLRVEIHDA